MNCGIENRSEGYTDSAATGRYIQGEVSWINHQQAKRNHGCGCETRAIHRISLSLWGIGRYSTFKGSLPSCAAVSQLPQIPSVHAQTAEEWKGEAEEEEEKDALGTGQVWLCGGLVGLADRFTSVHDCWLTCAFTGRRRRLGHCLSNVVQWGLSVHGDWKTDGKKKQ